MTSQQLLISYIKKTRKKCSGSDENEIFYYSQGTSETQHPCKSCSESKMKDTISITENKLLDHLERRVKEKEDLIKFLKMKKYVDAEVNQGHINRQFHSAAVVEQKEETQKTAKYSTAAKISKEWSGPPKQQSSVSKQKSAINAVKTDNNAISKITNSDWKEVTCKKQKKKSPLKAVIGSGLKTIPIKTAPRKGFIYVSRLDPSTTVADINELLKSKSPEVVSEKLETKYLKYYSAFKATVNLNKYDDAINPDLWPEGSYISRYFHPRKTIQTPK